MAALDKYAQNEHPRPSVMNALSKRVDVLSRLQERFLDAKSEGLAGQCTELREQLAKFDGVDPSEIQGLKTELNTLKIQNDTLRAHNSSTLVERDAARTALQTMTACVRWMCTRASDEKKLTIAVAAFVEMGKDAKPLIDGLLGNDTCLVWERFTSKQKLIETYRDRIRSTDADEIRLREFARMYLAQKHQVDVDKVLAEQAEIARKTQAEEDRRYERERQAREQAAVAIRQSQAMDNMIRAAEAGCYNRPAAPVVRGDWEW
jgi:hypothetical protein